MKVGFGRGVITPKGGKTAIAGNIPPRLTDIVHDDVFIGNHVWNNDTFNKAKILKETGENKFIDENLWNEFIDFCEKRLDDIIAREG